jgi:GGDEF domain-containing protein
MENKSPTELTTKDYCPQTPQEYAEEFVRGTAEKLTAQFIDTLREAGLHNAEIARIAANLDSVTVRTAIAGLSGVLVKTGGNTSDTREYGRVIDPNTHNERRRLQRAVERDPRTGLNNATMFDQARRAIERGDGTRSFVHIDLNNLGAFNAYTIGLEDTGNILIEASAIEMMLYFGGEGSNIFRDGGDEFKVLLDETADPEAITSDLMRNMGAYFEQDARIALMKRYIERTDGKLVDIPNDESELRVLIKHLNKDLYGRMQALDTKVTAQQQKGSHIERDFDDQLNIAILCIDGNVASLSAGGGKAFDTAAEKLAGTKKIIEEKYPTMKTLGKEVYEARLRIKRQAWAYSKEKTLSKRKF